MTAEPAPLTDLELAEIKAAWSGPLAINLASIRPTFARLLATIASLKGQLEEKEAALAQWRADWSEARHDADQWQAKAEELERLVYVPGQWRCAKCKFVVQKMVLSAVDGSVGVQADTKTEPCPNGCGPLWPMTERQSGNELCERLEAAYEDERQLKARAESSEREVKALREALEPFAKIAAAFPKDCKNEFCFVVPVPLPMTFDPKVNKTTRVYCKISAGDLRRAAKALST
jgi:hypothetical protein